MRGPVTTGIHVMSVTTLRQSGIRSNATFEPSAYRKSIAEMFGTLDPAQQRELVERFAVLPRHIHSLATSGLIADRRPARA